MATDSGLTRRFLGEAHNRTLASQAEPGNPLELFDRRHHRREGISFAYIELGEDNGGALLNIGQGGLALHAVGLLTDGQVSQMRFQFLHPMVWITATGRIVWTDKANKTAGIEFLDLSNESRAQIEAAIRRSGCQGEVDPEKEKVPARPSAAPQERPEVIPHFEHKNSDALKRAMQEPGSSASKAPTTFETRLADAGPHLRPDVSPQASTAAAQLPSRGAKNEDARTRILLWLLASMLTVALIVCFVLARRTESSAAKTGVPPESHMGLKLQRIGSDWQLQWNPDAPVISKAAKAHLLITDGAFQKFLDLDSSDLRSGTLFYTPLTNDVVLRLEVDRPDSADTVSESVRIDGPPNPSPAAPVLSGGSK